MTENNNLKDKKLKNGQAELVSGGTEADGNWGTCRTCGWSGTMGIDEPSGAGPYLCPFGHNDWYVD